MRNARKQIACSFACIVSSVALSAESDIRNAIEVAQIGDPNDLSWNDFARPNHTSTWSPDRQFVAVVLERPDVAGAANVGSLLIFGAKALAGKAAPRVVATMASRTNYRPIAQVRWLSDSQTVLFAGTNGDQKSAIYKVRVEGGGVEQMSPERRQLSAYETDGMSRRVVKFYEIEAATTSLDPRRVLDGMTLFEAENGRKFDATPEIAVLDVASGGTKELSAPEALDPSLERCRAEFLGGLSPDGRYGVLGCHLLPHAWPTWWKEYRNENVKGFDIALDGGNNLWALKLILVDLETGQLSDVSAAPWIRFADGVEMHATPFWSGRGDELILPGMYLPANGPGAELRDREIIGSFNPATKTLSTLALLPAETWVVTHAAWAKDGLTLQATGTTGREFSIWCDLPGRNSKCVRRDRRKRSELSMNDAHPIELSVKQTINAPPALFVSDRFHKERLLLDPNQVLRKMKRPLVQSISWSDPEGRTLHGNLHFPIHYVKGQRYPLVLQTHGADANVFAPNGSTRNFVAQPLAMRDIAVLQMDDNLETRGKPIMDSSQWGVVTHQHESAIEAMEKLGIADPDKLGITGWSATGPYVIYTLEHSRYHFAGAALTDTSGGGLWWYLTQAGGAGGKDLSAFFYDGAPYGSNASTWASIAPEFNFNLIRTPLFMWEGRAAYGLWDLYAAGQNLGKAVEYWVLPDGTHDLVKVSDRVKMNELLTDWFAFWLKAEEYPDPTKRDQYVRWRALRSKQKNDKPSGTTGRDH